MILERAADDLRRAGAVAVDEDDERDLGVGAGLGGEVVLVGVRHPAARVHDHRALREEAVGHLDRLVQRAAGIVPEVEHQPLHPLRAELVERHAEIVVGVLGELLRADVAGLRVHHERGRDRRDRDLVARHLDVDQLVVARALERNLDEGALRPPEHLDGAVGQRGPGQRLPLFVLPGADVLAGDAHDDVAAPDPLLVGRRAFEQRHDVDVEVDDLDRDPEAVVVPFLPLPHLLVVLRVHKARMRVERLQHAADGAVDQAGGIDLVDVIGLHGAEGRGELPVVGDAFGRGQRVAAEQPSDQRAHGDDEQGSRDDSVPAHEIDASR